MKARLPREHIMFTAFMRLVAEGYNAHCRALKLREEFSVFGLEGFIFPGFEVERGWKVSSFPGLIL